jgi:uncharacterized membrane protein
MHARQTARSNIEMVAKLEQQALEQRSRVDALGDAVANFIGSMPFVLVHVFGFILWAVVNSGAVPVIKPFDPYPYILLTMVVSMEGVIVGTFVLMKQNRMARRSEHRDHLNLQIDLLAEKEITKMLQLQRLMCERLGIGQVKLDAEISELSQHTAVEDLSKELERRIPAP